MLLEELRSLILEFILSLDRGEGESLGELDFGGGERLEAGERAGDVLVAAQGEVEGRAGCVRIHSLVVHLSCRERVAVPVSCHLQNTTETDYL